MSERESLEYVRQHNDVPEKQRVHIAANFQKGCSRGGGDLGHRGAYHNDPFLFPGLLFAGFEAVQGGQLPQVSPARLNHGGESLHTI